MQHLSDCGNLKDKEICVFMFTRWQLIMMRGGVFVCVYLLPLDIPSQSQPSKSQRQGRGLLEVNKQAFGSLQDKDSAFIMKIQCYNS